MDWELLAGLGEEERRRLLSVARRRTFKRDEVVVHREDPADTMHLIAKGRFGVQIVTPLGYTATLAVLGPGDTFGEVALVSDATTRSATVVALEPAETFSIHQIDFAGLRTRHPVMSDVLIRILARRVRALSDQVVEALYVDADRRVLRRVCELAATYDGDVPLTQEAVAGLAGTSRATVNRVLREAERRGEIKLGRGRISVLDRAELTRRAGSRPTA